MCICKAVDKNSLSDYTWREVQATRITLKYGVNQMWLLSLLFTWGWFLLKFSDYFLAGPSYEVSWLASATSFPFAPSFPLVCTFLSAGFCFPAAFLVHLPLGYDFTAPSADLTFLLGPLAVIVEGHNMAEGFENLGCLGHCHCPWFLW